MEKAVSMSNVILIVEDEATSLKLIKMVLHREGYRIATATNGSEALRIAEELRPDLILLDIMLPGLDGYQVCQYLRQNPHTEKVPVIMFSSLDRPADQRHAFEAGSDDYVTKPVKLDDLLTKVRSALHFREHQLN